MKLPHPRTLFATAISALALTTLMSAQAHGGDDHRKHNGKGWGHHKHDRDWHDDHGHRHYDGRTVIRERIIVREEPVYIAAPRVYDRSSYSYRRDPAIVIGVDIPPLVIPLR